jgi:hypothetical protein
MNQSQPQDRKDLPPLDGREGKTRARTHPEQDDAIDEDAASPIAEPGSGGSGGAPGGNLGRA